jgi:NADP-dependent 3-hydroxy acid dehydrogenase YdfG
MTRVPAAKTAVVTGVTSGIGDAVSARLLASGIDVVGMGRSTEKLERSSSQFGPAFLPLKVDLAAPLERERAIERLRELDRPIDVFVSNAAECFYESPLTVPKPRVSRLFEINVAACIDLCQGIVPLMRAGGHVVQISSVTARHLPNAKFAPYAITKLAVERWMEALRLELAPRGIRVSVVSPGLVDTPIYDKVEGFASMRAKIAEQIPEWLRADDVADAVSWILDRPSNVAVTELVIMPRAQTR